MLTITHLLFYISIQLFTFSNAKNVNKSNTIIKGLYTLDARNETGRQFDGIGGLSGGGATSKLLISYKEPYRSDILDVLFKPGVGASLQILKVEIGGDDQTTDGVEASHMHEPWDLNCQRGYEWWLIKEAKKRNPLIKLYALAWSFPYWIKNGAAEKPEYHRATDYIIKWLQCARNEHNITIDFIGLWNERYYGLEWILILRKSLDENDLSHVKILGADAYMDAKFVQGYLDNTEVMNSLYGLGFHYPGTNPPQNAIDNGKILWSSEDFSQLNNEHGAACWARTIVQNYVNGYLTAGIAWNLIGSYYPGLHFTKCSLMTAMEPWSGHYEVNHPIMMTSHLTNYTQVGWTYLEHGHGVGKLEGSGTYVTLIDAEKKHFTLVVETMTHKNSYCGTPLKPYNISMQRAVFEGIGQPFENVKSLCIKTSKLFWHGNGSFNHIKTDYNTIEIHSKLIITLELYPDMIITVSTFCMNTEGNLNDIPDSQMFPRHYIDNFEESPIYSDPDLLSPMRGAWEIKSEIIPTENGTRQNRFARQMVQKAPISWCYTTWWDFRPNTIIGDKSWQNVNMSVTFRIPKINGSDSIFLAARVNHTGCKTYNLVGLYFWLWADSYSFAVTADMNQLQILDMGTLPTKVQHDVWYQMELSVMPTRNKPGTQVIAAFDGNIVSDVELKESDSLSENGFSMIGSNSYGYFDIDDLLINVEY